MDGPWFKHDIEHGIKATMILAVNVHIASGARNVDHIGGILAHAQAQAVLYGLSWPGLVADCKRELGVDVGSLLDVGAVRVLNDRV